MAIGAGLLAVFAYTVNLAGIAGASGYFLQVITAELGAQVNWLVGTVGLLMLVGFVGYRSVRASAKIMGTILVLGLAVLLAYDVAILARRGLHAFPLESWRPEVVVSGSVGLALAIALTCFVGVDTAALYSEDRSPFRASLVVSTGTGGLIAIAVAFRLDPYVVLARGALGLGTLGIVTLQALAARDPSVTQG